MKKLIVVGLFMGMFIIANSQTITVIDGETKDALSHVSIFNKDMSTLVISNDSGYADLSKLANIDSIYFSKLGYRSEVALLKNLKKNNFIMKLNKSMVKLNEVIVSTYKENAPSQTSLHIESLRAKDIQASGSFSLTDALSKVPGISQLSTGIGISKPVIRGLFGNRILVLFSGLKFDNQQWQDEHGLGLSTIGISKVEIIKGPLSLLYGTEAIGGVINIIEENAAPINTSQLMIGVDAHSNTQGGTTQIAYKVNHGKSWQRLHFAMTNHADYTDGNHSRVLNSRFNGYYFKGSLGFHKKGWKSENHLNSSYNHFGFVFGDIGHFMEEDRRWSRKMSGPHHIVLLNTFSSVNRIRLSNSVLNVNAGIQSNLRSEDEGGGELSLKMYLTTGQYALKWSKSIGKNSFLVVAHNTVIENNTNYGRRKIIPDAWMNETAISAYLTHQFPKAIIEYGSGIGVRHIKTLLTKTVNSAEKDIDPFQQIRPFTNAMLGLSIIPNQHWNVKANLSTGVRAPNLAELSSNGLHEGIYTYEIGDPNMKNEQNINSDLSIYFEKNSFQFNISGFYNHFNHYIYLKPTTEEWFGFPVYRFKQHDAFIYGTEAYVGIQPKKLKGLSISTTYSGLIGALYTKEYLPYMPAQNIKPEIKYTHEYHAYAIQYFVSSNLVMSQKKINTLETITPAYQLINLGGGISFKTKNLEYQVNLVANNLLNEAYYDHLSRFKYFGLLNIGRDISINIKIKFKHQLKHK